MEADKIILDSGKIKVMRYTAQDAENSRIRSVVDDLYKNIPDLKYGINYIVKVKHDINYTNEDVIKEYISKYNSDDVLIMCTAGTLSDAMVVDVKNHNVIDGLKVITLERDMLYSAGFLNLVFKREMSRSYGDPNIFIYKSKAADEFISNEGDNVISRYSARDISSSK